MPRRLSKERTRKKMIDPELEKAGWYLRDHSQVKIEILIHSLSIQEELACLVARTVVQCTRDTESLLEWFDASRNDHYAVKYPGLCNWHQTAWELAIFRQ